MDQHAKAGARKNKLQHIGPSSQSQISVQTIVRTDSLMQQYNAGAQGPAETFQKYHDAHKSDLSEARATLMICMIEVCVCPVSASRN